MTDPDSLKVPFSHATNSRFSALSTVSLQLAGPHDPAGLPLPKNLTIISAFEDPVPSASSTYSEETQGNYGSNLACAFARNLVIPRLMQVIFKAITVGKSPPAISDRITGFSSGYPDLAIRNFCSAFNQYKQASRLCSHFGSVWLRLTGAIKLMLQS